MIYLTLCILYLSAGSGFPRCPEWCLGLFRRPQPTAASQDGCSGYQHFKIPATLSLQQRSHQRLVWRPGRVSALECSQNSGPSAKFLFILFLLLQFRIDQSHRVVGKWWWTITVWHFLHLLCFSQQSYYCYPRYCYCYYHMHPVWVNWHSVVFLWSIYNCYMLHSSLQILLQQNPWCWHFVSFLCHKFQVCYSMCYHSQT